MPVVFTNVVDPVGAGFVDSLAKPGGNVTGFVSFEYSLSAKWLELLKDIAPRVTRVAVIRDPEISAGTGQFGAIQGAASSFGLEVAAVSPREASEVERAIAAFARTPNGGLITTSSALAIGRRDLIVGLAAKHKLPAVYYRRVFLTSGGLISYGPDVIDLSRRAAGYVDRILKGENPAELPVQAPQQVRAGGQSENRKSTRPHHSAGSTCPRRRGDRIAPVSAAARNVCFWHKADITIALTNVRFWGDSVAKLSLRLSLARDSVA